MIPLIIALNSVPAIEIIHTSKTETVLENRVTANTLPSLYNDRIEIAGNMNTQEGLQYQIDILNQELKSLEASNIIAQQELTTYQESEIIGNIESRLEAQIRKELGIDTKYRIEIGTDGKFLTTKEDFVDLEGIRRLFKIPPKSQQLFKEYKEAVEQEKKLAIILRTLEKQIADTKKTIAVLEFAQQTSQQ